jgi:hypothetical protein
MQRAAHTFTIAFAITALTGTARAYDAEVDASTVGQAYQLRGLTGNPIISRRRVTQTLQLGVYNIGDATREGAPQVTFKARMRMDADFGMSRDEYTLPPNLARYVPLLQPAPVELMYGYLEGRRFAGGYLGFKVGRQYQIDPLGWYAFDGGLIRITTPAYFAVEAYGGWEVRGGLPLTTNTQIGRFEMNGVVRMDRSDLPPGAYPSVQPQSLAPVYGFAIETAGPTWIHGRLVYRKAFNTGQSFVAGSGALLGATPEQMGIYDRIRTASERIGYGLNMTLGELAGVRGNLIYDLYGRQFNDVELGTDLYVHKRVTASLDYSYWKPIFDADSIFNVFGFEPMDDFGGRIDVDVSDHLSVAANAMVRRYRSDDPNAAPGAVQTASSTAPGGGLNLKYKWPTARMIFRGSVLSGDQGRRVGGDLVYDKTLFERYFIDGRISLWDFKDKLRTDGLGNTRDATSVGYVVGAGYKLSPESNAMLQWEHDMNRLVGMRYRILAVLNVRVWL